MNMFHGTIRHHQAMFTLKILSIPGRALKGLLNQDRVFGMNPLENKLHGWHRGSVVLEDSKSFVGADDLAGGNPPAKTARVA